MPLKQTVGNDICINKSKFWDPTTEIINNKINSSDAIQNVENILTKVINRQTLSDVPLGVFLSRYRLCINCNFNANELLFKN